MNHIVPAPLIDWLWTNNREDTIFNHKVRVNLDWWNRQPETAGHPMIGTLDDGSSTAQGRAWISRRDLFRLVPGPDSGDPVSFLCHVVAWGTGTRPRLNLRRIQSIYHDQPRAEAIIREAARKASESATEGYMSLRGPGSTNALKFLGPAFFTKVLYFAGAGNSGHPCLIVDERVLATLRAWTCPDEARFNYRYGYPVSTYEAAINVMQEWAVAASVQVGRHVAADEVERWSFENNGRSA